VSPLLAKKTIEQSIADTEEPTHALRKRLGAFDLTVFGVGVVIGTGIFVLTGEAAAAEAGPAVAVSFVIAGIVCALAALCYAEFASTVPVAGSAYTFSYASLGELVAWIIGWDLILELALGAATVASGWSDYFVEVMKSAGWTVPESLYSGESHVLGLNVGHNFVAGAIVLVLTVVICLGIKVSSQVNAVAVLVKVGIVLFVIVAGFFYVKSSNYSPFVPTAGTPPAPGVESSSSLLQDLGFNPGPFGIGGVVSAAALVFFAFIGFDVVATAAEETKKPKRDLPIGIIASLLICTTLYVLVSIVVTGMVKFNAISVKAPLAEAFRSVGHPHFATLISVGALIGLTTVMMILMMGQSRVFFAMSRDRLLPAVFSKVSPRFGVPVRVQLTTGVVIAAIAVLVPLKTLAKLVNIGTLFAFVVVAAGVLVLRRTHPDLPRAFRTPLVPVLPIVSIVASVYLMLNLPAGTWGRFIIWMAFGFIIYFAYSARNSRLRTQLDSDGNPYGASQQDEAQPGNVRTPGSMPRNAR
jgi:APA family basic amino acid/polyamine antiporter